MPRFFSGNFDFEHHLANPGFQPSARLLQLNAELAPCWLALAEDGDFIWCPRWPAQLIPEFLNQLATHGLPRIIPVQDVRQVPPQTEFIPWGWTKSVQQLARQQQWSFTAPEIECVRNVNAREFSFELESRWNVGLPGASALAHSSELTSALERARQFSSRVVIKANWGMSGRERLLLDGPLTASAAAWVQRRLSNQRIVFVEPWLRSVEEAGLQIHIPPTGAPEFIGLTSLICDEYGQYRGSWFTAPPGQAAEQMRSWQPAIKVALQAADRIQASGYFGPLGIDAMRYALSDGSIGLRPLQDINARWTMGRLSLGLRRFLTHGEYGLWWHGTAPPSSLPNIHAAQQHKIIHIPRCDPHSPSSSIYFFLIDVK